VSRTYKIRRFMRAADLSPNEAHFTWNGTWLPRQAAGLMAHPDGARQASGALTRLVTAHGLPPRPSLRELQTADVTDYLPNDILAKSDRMSMAHGLEVRAPLLHPAIAEFALPLSPHLKLTRSGGTKHVLRELARRTYGVETTRAPKQGFSIPVHAWVRGPARDIIDDLLSPSSLRAVPELDGRAVSMAVDDHLSGRRSYGFEVWGLAVFVAWHRAFIQRAPSIVGGSRPRRMDVAACTVRDR
jgi:asparagine synthase (glutamine-hydrolysing)